MDATSNVVAQTTINAFAQSLRRQIASQMSTLPIPATTPYGEPLHRRGDGVEEFYKHWRIRGNRKPSGLYGTYSDVEDQIEIGLTDRLGNFDVSNVLQAVIVIYDDHAEMNVSSEVSSAHNFDAILTESNPVVIDNLLAFFRQYFVSV